MPTNSVDLSNGWEIVQDVHDLGETLGLFRADWNPHRIHHAVSEWQPIDQLKHLQLLLADHPYYGRELRYFNAAPWWYRRRFAVPEAQTSRAILHFDGVDYFAKVWLNGTLLGEHEGYSEPFAFEAGHLLRAENILVVKVSSPWDTKVLPGREGARFHAVIRNMVKGTYEHCDTFIQRDVNPIGIWRGVRLIPHNGIRCVEEPHISATIEPDAKQGSVQISWPVVSDSEELDLTLHTRVVERPGGRVVFEGSRQIHLAPGENTIETELSIGSPKLWSTWDRGGPSLYLADLELTGDDQSLTRSAEFGIRTIELRRTETETTYLLNGQPLFLRGTSYFPDCYLSAVTPERIERDIRAAVNSGMNAIRVHAHVQVPEFYKLCDELGVVVLQDSDLNWVHPNTEEFADRAVSVFTAMIRQLWNHPSVIGWICMNEPGGGPEGDMTRVSPGPQLFAAARELDPTRPAIKSSGHPDDLESGDSHTYTGSLEHDKEHYTLIRGTREKLCTEFGFDAPPALNRALREPRVATRLTNVLPRVSELHDYQYRLLKYYIEHYRMQKYAPCAGYFQFMWIDLCPQSFYGVMDYWGGPKAEGLGGGVRALAESNQPIGIFMEFEDSPIALWAVNDRNQDFGRCRASWQISADICSEVISGSAEVDLLSDAVVRIDLPKVPIENEVAYRFELTLQAPDGSLLAKNIYEDPFHHPQRPEGHPMRMDHELGMRLYWA